MQITKSLTAELLCVPELNARGVVNSIVFDLLPEASKAAILATTDENERVALACAAGDQLAVVAQIHSDFVAEPAERRAKGIAFPQFDNLDKTFLSGLVVEADRRWLKPNVQIHAIEVEQIDQDWEVRLSYADGQLLAIKPVDVPATQENCEALAGHIRRTATLFRALA